MEICESKFWFKAEGRSPAGRVVFAGKNYKKGKTMAQIPPVVLSAIICY
jgi:hypothetical protein